MARAVAIAVVCLVWGACSERAICPAFQSAYIHDHETLRKKFSYFQEDSTPKILTASKNRYLVAEPVPYRKKVRQMRTVEMQRVLVQVPDSLSGNGEEVTAEELDRAARSVIDSTFIVDPPAAQTADLAEDSAYVISKDRETRVLRYNGADSLEYDPVSNRYVAQKPKYYVRHVGLNIDMDNYMWYLRDHLVLPDVRLARAQQVCERAAEIKAEKKKKRKEGKGGIKGFFKNLFGKKQAADSVQTAPQAPEDEYNFINLDTLTQPAPPEPDPQRDPEIDPQADFFAPIENDAREETPAEPAIPSDPLPNDPRRQEEPVDDGF